MTEQGQLEGDIPTSALTSVRSASPSIIENFVQRWDEDDEVNDHVNQIYRVYMVGTRRRSILIAQQIVPFLTSVTRLLEWRVSVSRQQACRRKAIQWQAQRQGNEAFHPTELVADEQGGLSRFEFEAAIDALMEAMTPASLSALSEDSSSQATIGAAADALLRAVSMDHPIDVDRSFDAATESDARSVANSTAASDTVDLMNEDGAAAGINDSGYAIAKTISSTTGTKEDEDEEGGNDHHEEDVSEHNNDSLFLNGNVNNRSNAGMTPEVVDELVSRVLASIFPAKSIIKDIKDNLAAERERARRLDEIQTRATCVESMLAELILQMQNI